VAIGGKGTTDAMATTKLKIEIEALVKQHGFDKVKKSLDGIKKSANNSENALKKLDGKLEILKNSFGAIAAAAVTFKQAFELAEQGAMLQRAAAQFENLTQSIDSTSDAMLTRLRDATGGLISDANLIASASEIISLGLGKTEDEVVRLATVVSTLGLDMQQVIMTFANNSVMRLDALGLSVEDVQTKAKALEAQGLDADKAFDTAVLEALEDKMRLLGDTTDDSAASFQRLRVQVEKNFNTFTKWLSHGLTPVVRLMNGEYKEAIANTRQGTQELLASSVKLGSEFDTVAKRSREISRQLNEQFGDSVEVERGWVKLNGTTIIYTESLARMSKELEAASFDNFRKSIERTNIEFKKGGPLVDQYAKAGMAMARSMEATTKGMSRLNKSFELRGISNIDLFTKKIEDLGARQIFVTNRTKDQSKSLSELSDEQKRILDNIRSLESGTAGLGLTEDELNDRLSTQRERLNEVNAAMGPLAAITGEMRTVTNEAVVDQEKLNQALFDAVVAEDASTESITAMGLALGIYDETQAEAILNAELIKRKVEELAGEFARGETNVANARNELRAFIESLDSIPGVKTIDINVTASGSGMDIFNQFGRGGFLAPDDRQSTTNNTTNNVNVNIPVPISPGMGSQVGSTVANELGQGAR